MMSTGPREGDSSFSWPPSSTDLAAIDVMEFAGSVTPGADGAVHSAAAPDAPAVIVAATAVPAARSRELGRRRGRLAPPAVLAWAAAAPRGTRAGHLLLLGLGMLAGVAMPDLGDKWSFPARDGIVAHASSAPSPEAARLLAMRALLRGERTSAVGVQSPSDAGAEPHTLVAAAVADTSGDTSSGAVSPELGVNSGLPARTPAHPANIGSASSLAATADTANAATPTPTPADAGPVISPGRRRAISIPPDPYTAPVRKAVQSFEAAWTRMDSSATRAVWPTANAAVLKRTFTDRREQRLRLAPCRVERSGGRATATCDGTLRYRPRVGDHSTRVRRGTWEFELEQTGRGRWIIRRVETE